MSTALVRRFYEVGWGDGDDAVLTACCAADVVDDHHGTTGRDAVLATVARLRATLPDLAVRIDRQVDEGTTVVTALTLTGTDTGGLFGLPPSGNDVTLAAVFGDRVEDGRIVEHWGVSDMLAMLRCVEAIPADWRGERRLR